MDLMILYKIKLIKCLIYNKSFSIKKYKHLTFLLNKSLIKILKNNYKKLLIIFEDMDKNITFTDENYLLEENYFYETITLDYRMRLGMFIRSNYIKNDFEIDYTSYHDAETISFDIIIGYVYYLHKIFKIFK